MYSIEEETCTQKLFGDLNKKSIKLTIRQRENIDNRININLYEKEYAKMKYPNEMKKATNENESEKIAEKLLKEYHNLKDIASDQASTEGGIWEKIFKPSKKSSRASEKRPQLRKKTFVETFVENFKSFLSV